MNTRPIYHSRNDTIQKSLLRGALLLAWLALACGRTAVEPLAPTGEPRPGAPNFLIVLADDLGVGDVGAYGASDARTPRIDALAAKSLRFERAFVPTAMCSPSRAALYTGLYPHRNGLEANHGSADQEVQSFPHYLAPLGYRTAVAGKTHVAPMSAFPFAWIERSPEAVSAFLDEDPVHPFVLVIAQNEPHLPWPETTDFDATELGVPPDLIDTPELREARAHYLAAVELADAELGTYLDLIEARGIADETVVVFLSDHGAAFPFAKWTVYDAGLRVPLLIHWPDNLAPGTTNAMTSSIDLLPTLVELAGGEPPRTLDGESLVPLLSGELASHRRLVFGSHTSRGVSNAPDDFEIQSARSESFHYIRNLNPDTTFTNNITEGPNLLGAITVLIQRDRWRGAAAYWDSWQAAAETNAAIAARVHHYQHRPAEELYDLRVDPHELHNLAPDRAHAAALLGMRARLDTWLAAQNPPK